LLLHALELHGVLTKLQKIEYQAQHNCTTPPLAKIQGFLDCQAELSLQYSASGQEAALCTWSANRQTLHGNCKSSTTKKQNCWQKNSRMRHQHKLQPLKN
jgi:hypothetical protein